MLRLRSFCVALVFAFLVVLSFHYCLVEDETPGGRGGGVAAGEDGGPAGRLRLQGEFSARVFRARRALFLAFFSGTRRVPLLFLCFSWCAVFSVLRCVFHRFFALSPFYGGVEWAHLVSNILRCLLVNFGSLGLCFALVCADAQIKFRCCFALSTWKAQVNKAKQRLIFCSALGCLTQFTLSP